MAAEADTVVRARRAVVGGVEQPVAVGIRDGRIVAVAGHDELEAAEVVVLADDEVLLPGLVDTHVHVNEPGRTDWEGFESATRAAAAGGVTTIVDMPLNSIPPTTTVAALEEKRATARGRTFVDVGFWGGAVPGNVPDLEPLHAAGVFGFKCFLLDSGVPEFGALSAAGLAEAMAETARLGSLLLVHAEDADALVPCEHGRSYAGFLRSRPDAAEERAVDLVLRTARSTGGRAHVVHLSAAGALPALRAARDAGVDVSVETCPHYLHFEAGSVPDGATALKCCPPIRDAANRDALWAGLEEGLIDLVVTDHSPSTPELKGSGRLRRRLGRHRVPPARAAGGVDDRARARHPAGRRGRLDGDGPGRPGRPGRQGRDRRRCRRRPVRVRPRRGVRRRRGAAAPQEPGLGLRRAYAHRHRAPDLAGRHAGRPGRRAARPAAEED